MSFSSSVAAEPVPLRAFAQVPAPIGQVRLALPRSMIAPFAFTSNRAANGVTIAAAAGPRGTAVTSTARTRSRMPSSRPRTTSR
ncbi:hypothetical protein [Actinoplanes xinjiangensis]|uniref:hypothetical protein n=1 Tax=Actinoplanes xinjiangensis TaxID=512350 RepID=UPI000D6A8F00|nr:hypothetical protein [Actinoplanes xinjiangensis]